MGSASSVAAPAPNRVGKIPSPWLKISVLAVILVIIPMLASTPGADEGARNGLTLLWLGVAAYVVWKVIICAGRALFRKGAGHGARTRKVGAPSDVVTWTLPPASSSPSRADANARRAGLLCPADGVALTWTPYSKPKQHNALGSPQRRRLCISGCKRALCFCGSGRASSRATHSQAPNATFGGSG